MLAGRIGGLRCGVRFLIWQRLRVEMPVISYHAPSLGRGTPEGQGGGRRRKRVKPTFGATRYLLPKEGGRSGKKPSTPFPWKGDARRAGGWPKENESEANLHRFSLLPEEGGRSGENYLLPSRGRGMPEGQGVGRRQRERSQPPALRATSFQRKEGEVVKNHLPLPVEGESQANESKAF